MPYRLESQSHRSDKAMRCAACGGKFGLIHYCSWGTPLCSRKCVECFNARGQSDRNWIGRSRIAFDQSPENRARAS
jgi:hypothetical protein